MSQLDSLNYTSISGVPMRPKVKAPEPSTGDIAKMLAKTDARIEALCCTLTDQATARSMKFDFKRDAAGNIVQGSASNGEQSWGLSISRAGGALSVEVSPI